MNKVYVGLLAVGLSATTLAPTPNAAAWPAPCDDGICTNYPKPIPGKLDNDEYFIKWAGGYFYGWSRDRLIHAGHGVCDELAKGTDWYSLSDALEQTGGMSSLATSMLMGGAETYYCPNIRKPKQS